jgi:hypothetical protein
LDGLVQSGVGDYVPIRGPSRRVAQEPSRRHLFDWLVVGQVVPVNPAASSVRGPTHVVKKAQAGMRGHVDVVEQAPRLVGRAAPDGRSTCHHRKRYWR